MGFSLKVLNTLFVYLVSFFSVYDLRHPRPVLYNIFVVVQDCNERASISSNLVRDKNAVDLGSRIFFIMELIYILLFTVHTSVSNV